MTREEEIIADYEAALNCKLSNDDKEFILNVLQWADLHPKNPWRDAEKDPPADHEYVFIDYGKYHVRGSGFYNRDTKKWHAILVGEVCANYWMPIPELEGGEW